MASPPRIERLLLRDNNLWALPLGGGGWLLIDAGGDFDGAWEALIAQARAQGIAPEDVRTVVVTHEHHDHASLAARWASMGARVVASRVALTTLAAGHASLEIQRGRRVAELRRHGAPADVVEAWAARGAWNARWEPCPREALDDAGEHPAFRLAGGDSLRLVSAPGHTPGQLVALAEEHGLLFSGDAVLPDVVPSAGLHFPGVVEGDLAAPRWPSLPPFLDSITRLRDLRPAAIHPGHGDVIDRPGVAFDRFEAHHARRGARVRETLVAGPATAFAIARTAFPRLPETRLIQAMTEVLGHLDLLERDGLAAPLEGADGTIRWAAIRPDASPHGNPDGG